jgi:hypothetical protein
MQAQFLTRLTDHATIFGPRHGTGPYFDRKFPKGVIVRSFASHIQVFEIDPDGQLERSTFFYTEERDYKPYPNQQRTAVRLFVQLLRLIDLRRQGYDVEADPKGIFDYPAPDLSHL